MTYWNVLRRIGISALFTLSIEAGVRGDSVSLVPVEDATISEKDLSLSIGNELTLEAGTTGSLFDSRALLRFNLAASIPTNATVTSAALTVQLGRTAPGVTALWLGLHKVLCAWSESVVTWTNRLSPPTPWSVPGGAAAVDYASGATQSKLITTTLGPYTFAANAAMIADVQSWVANPSNNFGWVMISESEGAPKTEIKFASREDTANAPSLVVQFTVPALAPSLTLLPASGGSFHFHFNAESNRTYTAEYRVSSTNWYVLRNLGPFPVATNLVVSDPFSASNRFYRVRTP